MSVTTNATNIIKYAYILLGMVSPDESSVDSVLTTTAFTFLNEMIDGWGVQRQTMLARTRTVYNLTANQSTYTFGPSGNFNDTRPVTVEGAGLILNSSTPSLEIPLAPLTDDQYQSIGIKALTSTLPTEYYYNPTINSSGQGSFFLWPTPTVNTNQIAIYVPVAVSQFSDLTTNVTLAPMYAKCLRYGLARELAAGVRPLPPLVEQIYDESMTWLKGVNSHMSELSIDPALATQSGLMFSGYNVLTDSSGTGGQ